MISMHSKEILKQLGKRIKTVRLQKELWQKEAAQRCGFDKSSYNNIEAGKRNITILTLNKIALALEEPMSSFLTDDSFK
ncbi:MAG: helix-turn-helix transcriptional regulator [Flavobacteriaceae bacterium]|nr:helix-turn-helix transcriptional regulator [Flavobacteriaceae bacterium]